MQDCGKCLHEEVCAAAKACDGHVPRCKHFMDKDERFTAQTAVQVGKPLEAFLHPIIAYKGLKAKYLVFNAASGKMIENCFVLRPEKDAAAVEALRAYANTTENKTLAEDIYNWVGKGVTVQDSKVVEIDQFNKWIPVTERLPSICEPVLVCCDFMGGKAFRVSDRYGKNGMLWTGVPQSQKVTHWMPLPEPPKEGTT